MCECRYACVACTQVGEFCAQVSCESRSFIVFTDGHAGPQCAELLKELLYRNIMENASFAGGKVPEAMHEGFLKTDAQVHIVSGFGFFSASFFSFFLSLFVFSMYNVPRANPCFFVSLKILEVAAKENWRTGSTAVVACIVNNVLWVANVGDSELVLARRRRAVCVFFVCFFTCRIITRHTHLAHCVHVVACIAMSCEWRA